LFASGKSKGEHLKKKALAPSLILGMLLPVISLLAIPPVKGSVENVGTSCYLFADDIVEPQRVTVEVQIFPAPPEGEVFNDIGLIIVSPLQGTVGNYPWGTGPWDKTFSSDTDGKATVTFDVHTFGGYWIVLLSFGGQYFANDTIYYEPLQAQRNFFVSSLETPTPSPTASPSPSPEPTSSPEPTPIPTPTEEPQQPEEDMTVGAVFAVASIIIFLGLQVLFIKRRKSINFVSNILYKYAF
jgi:hypothetical protein